MANKKRFATKKRKLTRRDRVSTAGKILPPLDVRSSSAMGEFVKRITSGPLTIVMVYADWCGHCHHMMPHFDAAANNPKRTINVVKMNETMVDQMNKSIKNNINASSPSIKVDGYPSIMLMGKNGKKVTDIEAVKSTEAMEKVMNQAVPLYEEAGLADFPKKSTNNNAFNTNMGNKETMFPTTMSPEEKEAKAASALESVSSSGKPNFAVENEPGNPMSINEPGKPLPVVAPPQAYITKGGNHQDKKTKGLYHYMSSTPYRLASTGALFSTIRRMMSCKKNRHAARTSHKRK